MPVTLLFIVNRFLPERTININEGVNAETVFYGVVGFATIAAFRYLLYTLVQTSGELLKNENKPQPTKS